MADIEYIKSLEKIKLLSDARRMQILRLLMSEPATLTQLGHILGEHPAWVRHHLKKLEQAGLIEMTSSQVSGGFIEKFYQAKAGAYIFFQTILPEKDEQKTILFQGSHDLALAALARNMHEHSGINLLVLPVGSLEGLVALRQGTSQITGVHLLDVESGRYNLPYVRHFFPDRSMRLVTLAHRAQGLIVAPGNPHHIQGIADLSRPDVCLINRNPGSGTRLWLDKELHRLDIPPQQIKGYHNEVRTHSATAQAVLHGRATTGLGLEAAARQAGLDFIPLFHERYDLVIPEEMLENANLQTLLNILNSAAFRQAVIQLGGYETSDTGEELHP